jgi:FixJ family two-component response regulator
MISDSPTIFVIDDDASVRKSLSRLLESMGFTAETFGSAEEFLERGHFEGIGCIVLDVAMPGLNGLELQDRLNKSEYTMPVIFITGHGDIPMSVTAMKKGAVDFLAKPFDDEGLLDAVRTAVEKDRKSHEARIEMRDIRKRIDRLTPRETQILRYVISGMLNKQIAFHLNIAEKTVKIHRANIMEKLHVTSVADLVRLAGKAGIESAGKEEKQ